MLKRPITRAQAERELLAYYHQAGYQGDAPIAWTEELRRTHAENERRYAQVLLGPPPPHFELAPQTVYLPAANRRALFAHEVGHVIEGAAGSEDDADAAANRRLGVRVGYDHRWPGKGLQVELNPDPVVRELERRWQASGTSEGHARFLVALSRSGGATPDQLWKLQILLGEADPARLWILARMDAPERDLVQSLLGPIPVMDYHFIGDYEWDDWRQWFYLLLVADLEREHAEGEAIPPHRAAVRFEALAAVADALAFMWDQAGMDYTWDDVRIIPEQVARRARGAASKIRDDHPMDRPLHPSFLLILNEVASYLTQALGVSQQVFTDRGLFAEEHEVPYAADSQCMDAVQSVFDGDTEGEDQRIFYAECMEEWGQDQGGDFWDVRPDYVEYIDGELRGVPPPGYTGLRIHQYCTDYLQRWLRGQALPGFRPNPPRQLESPWEVRENPTSISALKRIADMGDPLAKAELKWRKARRKYKAAAREVRDVAEGRERKLTKRVGRGGRNAHWLARKSAKAVRKAFSDSRKRLQLLAFKEAKAYEKYVSAEEAVLFRSYGEAMSSPRLLSVETNPREPSEWKDPPPCAPRGLAKKLKYAVPLKSLVGKRVRIHVNLHNGCYVVSHKGHVAGYTKSLRLKSVLPKISIPGWEACNTTKVRNVHAYIEGTLVSPSAKKPRGAGWKKITYRCKTHGPSFYYSDTGESFEGAQEIVFMNLGGRGFAQIGVLVKGRAPARSNPSCGCSYPGGGCACGSVQNWWREEPPGCGSCA